MSQEKHLEHKIIDLLRMIDGFTTEAVAKLVVAEVMETEAALTRLKQSGVLMSVYEPMEGYIWVVIR